MSKKLKAAREASGKTQAEVAKEAGITERGYQKIEARDEYRAIQTANRIARAVKSTTVDLWGFGEESVGEATPDGDHRLVGSSERPTR